MLTGCLYTPRIRTVGGTSWAEVFFTGGDIPPPVMPDTTRVSRAKSPYFGGMSRGRKSGIHVAWMLAFAHMTREGEASMTREGRETSMPVGGASRNVLKLVLGGTFIKTADLCLGVFPLVNRFIQHLANWQIQSVAQGVHGL